MIMEVYDHSSECRSCGQLTTVDHTGECAECEIAIRES